MEIKHRGLAPRIFCVLAAALLAWACVPEKRARPVNKTRRGVATIKPAPPTFKLELPKLVKPTARPAARVVHLLYTSNVDGELAPCG